MATYTAVHTAVYTAVQTCTIWSKTGSGIKILYLLTLITQSNLAMHSFVMVVLR